MRNLSGSRKIYAAGSVILGVLLLFWPQNALRMAAYAVGLVMMAGGIASLLSSFNGANRRMRTAAGGAGLLTGAVVTLIGGWIFFNPEDFAAVIPTAVGYFILISGVVKLLGTFGFSRTDGRGWWASLFSGAATVLMGFLLISHAFGFASFVVRLGGAFLLVSGLSDLWVFRRVDRYARSGGGRPSRDGGTKAQEHSGGVIIDASESDYREL